MMVYHRDGCVSRELAWLQNTECVGSLGEKAFSDAHMACEQHGGAEGGEKACSRGSSHKLRTALLNKFT